MGMRYQDGMPRHPTAGLAWGFASSVITLCFLGLVAVLLLTGCAWNEHHARVSPRLDMDKHSATTY